MKRMQLTVLVLIGVALVHGATMRTAKEVEDFKTYLENSVFGNVTEPLSPELAILQNPDERSGKFEGDMLLTPQQIEELVGDFAAGRNGMLNNKYYWPNGVVYYTISKSYFTTKQIEAIELALKEIEKVTCVRFKPATSSTKNYVTVKGEKAGCTSYVGMIGGSQTLNLSPNNPGSGCFIQGIIIHEFSHALGFYHMQSASDRDTHVKIVWNKIEAGRENSFKAYTNTQVSGFGQSYDFGSILHYSEYAFSIDGSKTIVPLRETSQTIGQRVKMSSKDTKKINSMYKCP